MRHSEACEKLIKIIENGSFKKIAISAKEIHAYPNNYLKYVEKCREQEKTSEHYRCWTGLSSLMNFKTDCFEFKETYILQNTDSKEWKDEVISKLKFYIKNRIFSIKYYLLDSNDNIMNEERSYTLEESFDTFILYSLY